MKKIFLSCVFTLIAADALAEPVDMTGLICARANNFGIWTWEFYGDVAMRYHEDGSRSRLQRIGTGAYEKYDRNGEWTAIYYFHKIDEGLRLRILARPGLIERDQDSRAPLKTVSVPMNGKCFELGQDF